MSNTGLLKDTIGSSYGVSGAGTSALPSVTATGDTAGDFNGTIAGGTSAQVIQVRFIATRLAAGSGEISLTGTGTLTVTNGTDTFTVTATHPKIWAPADGACPFTVDTGVSDATALKFTTSGASPANDLTVFARFLQAPA